MWNSIASVWFQTLFLGSTLSQQQQLILCFSLTCLAVPNNQPELPAMWTSLLRCFREMASEITHPLTQGQVGHILFSCLPSWAHTRWAARPIPSSLQHLLHRHRTDMQISMLACRRHAHTIFGVILSRHKRVCKNFISNLPRAHTDEEQISLILTTRPKRSESKNTILYSAVTELKEQPEGESRFED